MLTSGAESANLIRVTLSESARERLWVAEVVEGNETHVAMVHVGASASAGRQLPMRDMVLRREQDCRNRRNCAGQPYSGGALEINGHFVVMFADRISIFSASAERLDGSECICALDKAAWRAIREEFCWQARTEVVLPPMLRERNAPGAIPCP